MKNIRLSAILSCLILLSIDLLAQKIDASELFQFKDGKIHYSEVVALDSSISADVLYLRARKWVVDNFNSGKSVIQIDDKDSKTLIVKGFFDGPPHLKFVSNPEYWCKIKIEAKDGRYKYELYDLRYTGAVHLLEKPTVFDNEFGTYATIDQSELSVKRRAKVKVYFETISSKVNAIIFSLKEAMAKPSEESW